MNRIKSIVRNSNFSYETRKGGGRRGIDPIRRLISLSLSVYDMYVWSGGRRRRRRRREREKKFVELLGVSGVQVSDTVV